MRRKTVFAIALGLSTLLFGDSSLFAQISVRSVAQYQGVIDPVLDEGEALLFALTAPSFGPMVAGPAYFSIETARLNSLNYLAAIETALKERMAAAITTNTVKNMRVSTEAGLQSGRCCIKKLHDDLKWYEDHVDSSFAFADYTTDDRTKQRFLARYRTIQAALKHFTYKVVVRDLKNPSQTHQEEKTLDDAEQTLERAGKSLVDGMYAVMDRALKREYVLTSLRTDSGFLAEKLQAFHEALFGIEQLALELSESGATPRKQIRATFANQSQTMLFFVQIESRDRDGNYSLRSDCSYPVVLYPDLSKLRDEERGHVQYVFPHGQRGPSEYFIGVQPRDKIIVRAATMNKLRDHVRFMPIQGKSVHPDLNSLSRGFYYLGYETETPQRLLATRVAPIEETYQWSFRNGWAPGTSANDPKLGTSDPSTLRSFGAPLKLQDDRMEWIAPASPDAVGDLGVANAEVSGKATYEVMGTRRGNRTGADRVDEEGSGKLQMMLELW